jgi:dihydrofolate synthase / folylpolyglutamate synthase
MFEQYRHAVNLIEGLANMPRPSAFLEPKRSPEIYIKRMEYFLGLIGRPERGLNFVHIGGTSGKGTVTDMVHRMIRFSGRRIGSFSSPPVTSAIERIKVDDLFISPDEFAHTAREIMPAIDKAYRNGPFGGPSAFEIYFAIALMHFKRMKCDWCVLEVGLGGRYDATNIIRNPAVTAITSIGYDHTDVLGKTLKKIAADKAGIIKRGSRFFSAESRPAIRRIFEEACRKLQVECSFIPANADYREMNKALAAEISRHLGIDVRSIERGMKASRLPCRFEIMQKGPLVVLDGAHNPSKIRSTIDNIRRASYRHLHLVIGSAADKDYPAMVAELAPFAERIYATRFSHAGRICAEPKEIAAIAKLSAEPGTAISVHMDAMAALDEALALARPSDMILAVGSFFLAGELRQRWVPEEYILQRRMT